MAKIPAEYIFKQAEARYQAARKAQADGEISEEALQTEAYRATEAAQLLAQKKGWQLPFFKPFSK
jgi:hypothetical protein